MTREQEFEVAIVGAGFAGLYLLYRLRELNISARVIEAGSGVGGTWYWNRYPGARCDIESLQYSYQFDDALQKEWEWTERYAPQPEILEYAEHVADRFDLRSDIQFNTRVTQAQYTENTATWQLMTDNGSPIKARFCVMATGCLSKPNWPAIPGLDHFKGPTYHTAKWPHESVDFSGQRVAVIGTGSSAIQSIPLIADQASELTVFQRTPNYSIPARNGPHNSERARAIKADYPAMRARAKQNFPGIDGVYNPGSVLDADEREREAEFEKRWQEGGLTFMGSYGDFLQSKEANELLADFVRRKIKSIVKDPQVAKTLCPDNIIGGKRLCVDTNYYETYNRDNVRLVNVRERPIEKISDNAVYANGETFEIDALVIATGFDAMTGALMNVDIRGRNNQSLKSRWANGPSSYLGLAMADFPNLFTVTGPGSPSVFTNMLPTIEQHVDWIADCLGFMKSKNLKTIEAEEVAEKAWWRHCQEVAAEGLKTSTDSWYLGANVSGKARVFMPYFGGFPNYCKKCEQVVIDGYDGFSLN